MVGPWRHPPGTLRALIATFGQHYVICRPCRRYTLMRVESQDLDRKFEPCPFRCDVCKRRGFVVVREGDRYRIGYMLCSLAALRKKAARERRLNPLAEQTQPPLAEARQADRAVPLAG